jgi:hypothetical protein
MQINKSGYLFVYCHKKFYKKESPYFSLLKKKQRLSIFKKINYFNLSTWSL